MKKSRHAEEPISSALKQAETAPVALPSPVSVHIVLSDKNWILERLAQELTQRLPYVTYGSEPDCGAVIQYYVTYGARRKRVSPVEISLFTYREEIPEAAERFDTAAREIDFAIATSDSTEQLLATLGVERRTCISPGVDLDHFCPKLKIAVVGDTDHTGRKGEALVRAMMDLPHIEWHFTGEGWPNPAEHMPEADLPAFYRAMDYILVPALSEDGPMSVLEALACGVPVIGSMVGWVPDFPHIPFERGDAESLRAVLQKLTTRHFALRTSVDGMTWDRWAHEHDRLFGRLLAGAGASASDPAGAAIALPGRTVRSAALLTHGSEHTTLGGPSVRVPRTVAALQALNLRAKAVHNFGAPIDDADVTHLFNVWHPASAVYAARYLKSLSKPLILSPIMLDLSEVKLWRDALPRAFADARTPAAAEGAVALAVDAFTRQRAFEQRGEPEPGYCDMVTELAELADGLVFLSTHERAAFIKLTGAVETPGYLVRNPVDAALFGTGDPDLFRTTYRLTDYVLCVARLESRKNQLMLAAALRDTGMPLVLIGHSGDVNYVASIDRFGGPDLLRIDRLKPGSEMLRSAIAGARVFALPSWAEGAPLAALEAAAAGANLVLSDRSGEREYFGSYARYCDPSSIASIREEITAAWESAGKHGRAAQKAFVATTYTWEEHARETLAVYEEVASRSSPQMTPAAKMPDIPDEIVGGAGRAVVMDITTWANQVHVHNGILRVERCIARELLGQSSVAVRFVMYHSSLIGFVEVPAEVVANDFLAGFVAQARLLTTAGGIDLSDAAELLALGSEWAQDLDYGFALALLARDHGLALTVLMHDMTPTLFPHWYPAGYSDMWEKNCAALLGHANRLLVCSDSTLRDVRAFAAGRGIALPSASRVRLADKAPDGDGGPSADLAAVSAELAGKPYVLSLGDIHMRSNYQLLYDVWLKLADEMGPSCPHLVIVGDTSWDGAELVRIFREDRRISRHVHLLIGVDDGAVEWLYANALMTAYPSLYEGWGLPVGESLARGRICLSSNRSSMPEVAPALTDLLDPVDRMRWAALIRHYATSSSSRAQREAQIRHNFVSTRWSDTTKDLLRCLATPTRAWAGTPYNLGSIMTVAKQHPGETFLGQGWFRSESWGSWASMSTATIVLTLLRQPAEMLVLNVLARVFKRADAARCYTVLVNGVCVCRWAFLPDRVESGATQVFEIHRARIAPELVGPDCRVMIEFVTDQHTAVAEIWPGTSDRRSLGLGLVGFSIDVASIADDPLQTFGRAPEINAMLARAGGGDVTTALTGGGVKPTLLPDRWQTQLAHFLQHGLVDDLVGLRSEGGVIQLAFGLLRARLDRSASLELIIDACDASPDLSVGIGLFFNDRWIGMRQLTSPEPSLVGFEIDATLLACSDPATINLICKVGGGVIPQVTLSRLRLVQQIAAPVDPYPLVVVADGETGLPHDALREGWYDREPDGVWSLGGTGRLAFSIVPYAEVTTWLMLQVNRLSSGGDNDAVEVIGSDGVVLANTRFPRQEAGLLHPDRWLAVPLSGPVETDGRLRCDLAITGTDLVWPARFDKTGDQRRLGVRLRSASLRRLVETNAATPVNTTKDARIG